MIGGTTFMYYRMLVEDMSVFLEYQTLKRLGTVEG